MGDWAHRPIHLVGESGAYIVTAGTFRKEPIFRGRELLKLLCTGVLAMAKRYEWNLQAWAVFPNHYHMVAVSEQKENDLRHFIRHLHSITARVVNLRAGSPGRKVWFEYWDTRLTYERAYLARLHYVHANAVHHGLVKHAEEYPWCSAGWLRRNAKAAFQKTVMSAPFDTINLRDDFEVKAEDWG